MALKYRQDQSLQIAKIEKAFFDFSDGAVGLDIDVKLVEHLLNMGYENVRYIDGLGYVAGMRMMFTYGLFVGLTKTYREGRFCFHTRAQALDALNKLNNKSLLPCGEWIKYKGSVSFSRIPDPFDTY